MKHEKYEVQPYFLYNPHKEVSDKMLEICFYDCIKGALQVAQHCGDGRSIGGAISIITSSKNKLLSFFEKRKALRQFRRRQEELQKQAISLGGNREDILGISFHLSNGDIIAPIEFDKCPRKDLIFSLITFNRYDNEVDEKSALKYWQDTINDFERLKQGADKVRIWVDSTPDATCGLLFVADLLANTDTEIHIVSLPKKHITGDCIVEFRGWGEVPPELFGTFLSGEKILSKEEVSKLSLQWKKIQLENASLRVVENDKVISVDENYYDDLIRSEYPKENCKIGVLIGNSLGKQKIPTGDVFIAKRIKIFIVILLR